MQLLSSLAKSFVRQSVCSHSRAALATLLTRSAARAMSSAADSQQSGHYDVIICGGGIVGAAMAAKLGSSTLADRRILLLEGGKEKPLLGRAPDIPSSRTCALNRGTQTLLDSFGAWSIIESMRLQEVKHMQVWDSASDSMISFNTPESADNLAYIVENDIIFSAIMQRVLAMSETVDVKYESRISGYQLPVPGQSEPAKVVMESGDELTADLLIGADGYQSGLRKSCGIHTVGWDYNEMAVVSTLNVSEDVENNAAWQRFLPTGPIAMLPVSPKHSCLIWSTTTEEAKRLLQLTHDSFVDAVNDAFWSTESKSPVADYVSRVFDGFLNSVGFEGSSCQQLPPTVLGVELFTRGAFPLGLCLASQYIQSRVALIGDAAHRLHPLAGQGVNLGFGDVSSLVGHLESAVLLGADIGSIDHLLDYERDRQRHVVPVAASIDLLSRMYTSSLPPVHLARAIGLQTVHAVPQIKSFFMQRAMS